MARLGLGASWKCLMANDICAKKAAAYRRNFPPGDEYLQKDIRDLTLNELPGRPFLVWASFPCQDLSLAGSRQGLKGGRSGTFWPFWNLVAEMARQNRAIPMVVLENVVGAITSHGGADFRNIVEAFVRGGYGVGAIVIDAIHFVPQSRPRLFVLAVHRDWATPSALVLDKPEEPWHPTSLVRIQKTIHKTSQDRWIWWRFPPPPPRNCSLAQVIDESPLGVNWHSHKGTLRLISLMSERNLEKLKQVEALNERTVGTLYKRTRRDSAGNRMQRAEVRFDQVSGCLRTPSGGSSRQIVMVVEGKKIRSRLLSPREAARLMGVGEDYALPENYNEAYHLMGDGVVVPAVAWLEHSLLRPWFTQILKTAEPMPPSKEPIIFCKLQPETRRRIEAYAEGILSAAPGIGNHGLSTEEFWDSGIFRSAVERLRGQQAATTSGKKEFMTTVLNFLKAAGRVQKWDFSGAGERHDYEIAMADGRISVVETKGCLDGNNTNIFERPPQADEFIIWSLCQNPGSDPRHNAWSGIHTRLSAEIIHRQQRIDGVVIWDMVCGTAGRPCPKLKSDQMRATVIKGPRSIPPPCIYLFPRSIPDPRNNPRPNCWELSDISLLQSLWQSFKGDPTDVVSVFIEARMHGADVQRRTLFVRESQPFAISSWTTVRRARR